MAKRLCGDWLKTFVDYASFGEAPLKMLFWTGISTVAGALRRRVWIDQKYFQWLPNFYIVLVAPPGIVSKSTTANIGMNLLREVRGPSGATSINFGPDIITWQAILTALEKFQTGEIDSRTGEIHPMAAVTFCSDELGNLLKPQDTEFVDLLVALWDGKRGSLKKETKNSGSNKIENPWVNIIGCTTPSWIAGNFPEYMIGGGFTSRCVFVYADKKRQLVPYVDEVVPANFEETKQRLIHDLTEISNMFGEFTLSTEARTWGRSWYKAHWDKPPAHLTGDQFAGYLSRKQTHLHKLAMVLSASESDELVIHERHLVKAFAFAETIEADMPKVFARIGQTMITRGSSEILEIVRHQPGINQSDLYKRLFRTMSYQDFVLALNGCINSSQLHSLNKDNNLCYWLPKSPEAGAAQ